MRFLSAFFLTLILFSSCQKAITDPSGIWRAEVPTVIGPISFNLSIEKTGEVYHVFAINGDEKLELDTPKIAGDSIFISMEIFDAEIKAKISSDKMEGIYAKKLADNSTRSGKFLAEKGKDYRFAPADETSTYNVAGKWASTFTDDEGSKYEAVGLFEQNGNKVKGTFLTSTGDYRYLAGNVVGDSLMLSCFDGTHIFLFKAKIEGEKLTGGRFSSSLLYQETWEAKKDENAELPDPESLTYLNPGFEKIAFKFVNTNGDSVSLNDEKYKGKVVLVQIMGSWCPNCMDESRFLAPWYEKNKERGVEIIGLSYEKSTEAYFAFPKINKMKERFGIGYEVLLAGKNSGVEAQKSLPMLNHIMSFPTTIFIDKKGIVRKIHTGFSGPSTGDYFEKYKADFERFMDLLIDEK